MSGIPSALSHYCLVVSAVKKSRSRLNTQKKKSTDHKSRVAQPTYIYTPVSTLVLQVNLE